MRVLFSSVAGYGHLFPLLPLAQAFRDRGDAVAVATSPSYARQVDAAGLRLLPAGLDEDEINARFAPIRAKSLTLPIPDRRPFVFSHRFGLLEAPTRIDELREHALTFRADVLIHESAELAAPVVAAQLGLPSVQHSFGRMVSWAAIEAAAVEVAPLWERAGVEPEPYAGMFRGSYVDICPPSLDSERPPEGTTVLPRRPVEANVVDHSGERPLIYATLGTVVNSPRTLVTLLAGLAELDADVLLTTGWQNDPAELGAIPANATVERFVPQDEVLPRCSVIVTHAGSGSMLGALAHGVPMLAVPHAADQFENSAASAATGAARVVMPDELSERAVHDAAHALLDDPSYRNAAHRIAAEIAAMPDTADVAQRIEEQCLTVT
ncbi:MAG TPA: glycosyltransferase [Gaiellaceae bacterium]|jgi:UDP:flavonoid glycosyltransferase YjiC (YdhE family)|nr:glycosyltransferase [Gaiellaceae bacterium]